MTTLDQQLPDVDLPPLSGAIIPARVELWVLAADASGPWLLSGQRGDLGWEGGPWYSPRLRFHEDPELWATEAHTAVQDLLYGNGEGDGTRGTGTCLIHSFCWRPTARGLLLTYTAVRGFDGSLGQMGGYDYVRDRWRHALPIGVPLYQAHGGPEPHGATEQPCGRDIDVLWQQLGGMRLLRDTNAQSHAELCPRMRRVLNAWRPILAGLYLPRVVDPIQVGDGRAVTEPATCEEGCPQCSPCVPCLVEGDHPACAFRAVTVPDLPGERGCCCGELEPA